VYVRVRVRIICVSKGRVRYVSSGTYTAVNCAFAARCPPRAVGTASTQYENLYPDVHVFALLAARSCPG
jgi:hypothetical protein